ncbi:UPF0692 protein C19orf54 homolog [Amphibalanus amphitrite]|uniref:UPF0692 protein C19orf54 homolog n=1 Tax=Amphibalanus amphitrite TaxID=1232801 RepID=UPI001C9225A7|nr:UPF0692 protein C19orf54 homolog [Amphibalanus amphitrite]XP_043224572.1 UPF0692 protein C19orf54 homolog [Amphibalanus amphitrite]
MKGESGPPPPPPPPPVSLSRPLKLPASATDEDEDVLGAVAFRAARASLYHRLIIHLNETQPIIQEGPTCGLAAASMALAQLGRRGDDVTVTSLLQEARCGAMTAQGEMFSAADLARLVAGRLAPDGDPATAGRVRSDLDRPEAVLRAVLRGDAVLVPYDADRNHAPCARGGAAAHWALVCGVLVGTAADADDPRETDTRPPTVDETVYPAPPQLVSAAAARADGLRPDRRELLLLCRQSKSRRLAVWRYGDLVVSNAQLRAARPHRDGEQPYVLSQGSVEAGLCGQWVHLWRPDRGEGREALVEADSLADWLLGQEASDGGEAAV